MERVGSTRLFGEGVEVRPRMSDSDDENSNGESNPWVTHISILVQGRSKIRRQEIRQGKGKPIRHFEI